MRYIEGFKQWYRWGREERRCVWLRGGSRNRHPVAVAGYWLGRLLPALAREEE